MPRVNRTNYGFPAGASFIRLPRVRERVGWSTSQIYREMKFGRFPRPYNLGPRSVAWVQRDIDDWIAARMVARDTTPPRAA